MAIIVDGYNYIGRSQTLRLSDPKARDTIISLFGQYCRKTRKAVTIIFDGTHSVNLANRKRQYGRVKVIYTSPMSSADDLIKKLIRERAQKQRKGVLIVTSDEDIGRYAAEHEIAWIRSENFEQTVQRTLTAPSKIDRSNVQFSPEEVQQWLEIFGATDEEPADSTSLESRKNRRMRREQEASRAHQPALSSNDPPPSETEEKPERVSKRRPIPRPSQKPALSDKGQSPAEVDRINVHLSQDEVEAWLKFFQNKKNSKE